MNFETIRAFQSQAPKDHAPIEIVCVRPELGERIFPNEIEVNPKDGVVGDRWSRINWVLKDDGTPDERNQISILPKRIYEAICLERSDMFPGDNIVADIETSFQSFPIGTVLQVGSAKLRVSDVPNYACEKWRDRYGMDTWKFVAHKDWQHMRLRGFLCQVIEAGVIKKDDIIVKI